VIVGGDPRKRGSVQSATQDALDAGVEVGIPMLAALELCPRARTARTDMKRYRAVSGRLRACLRADVDALEPVGLEAAYLDSHLASARAAVYEASRRPSGSGSGSGLAVEQLALRLQQRVAGELALPLRVGIASVKFLARLAAEEAGPSGLLHVTEGGESDFLQPLPLGRLPGVGPRTVARLRALGAVRIGDLLGVDPNRLEDELGNHGLRILEYARGEDHARVRAATHPQTLGKEHTFDVEQLDLGVLWEQLQNLAASAEGALRREGLSARRVAVKVRYSDGETSTRSQTLPGPASSQSEIYSTAAALLERTHAGSRPISRLGVTLAGLAAGVVPEAQLDLFSGAT
jgi:DNA polymerase-4